MRNIIQAMRCGGVRRLIAISASPLSDDSGDTWLFRRVLMPLTRAAFRSSYADMARMEDEMRQSDLAWTIVRPPRLTDKPRRGRYRTAWNRRVRGGFSISRADLADAILKLLTDPRSIHAAIDVGY
jgi:putative NADH-flavin reductase